MESKINNDIYDDLGESWYTAYDNPVALLRQESKVKAPWVFNHITTELKSTKKLKVLDVGCGAGFLSNELAQLGKDHFEVQGLDMSKESLSIAHKYDKTKSVKYTVGDANHLKFEDGYFDVVTAMDFLEHVENPQEIINEMSRVLRPGGLFFFHTFNRNKLAHLVIIKLVEWLVKNTPKNMHVIELFITPQELAHFCSSSGMHVTKMTGIKPKFSTVTLKSVLTRTVPKGFAFELTNSLKLSYLGYAKKQ